MMLVTAGVKEPEGYRTVGNTTRAELMISKDVPQALVLKQGLAGAGEPQATGAALGWTISGTLKTSESSVGGLPRST